VHRGGCDHLVAAAVLCPVEARVQVDWGDRRHERVVERGAKHLRKGGDGERLGCWDCPRSIWALVDRHGGQQAVSAHRADRDRSRNVVPEILTAALVWRRRG